MNNSELYALWNEFLDSWPVERVRNMTLEEYTEAGNPDAFTHWVEFRTKPLATISGSSSFIFGIYSRKDQSPKNNTKNHIYEDQYAWRTVYGKTKEQAFTHVKAEIIKVIEAVISNQLNKINDVDLITTVKWKIAFLYQDRENIKILPTFAEQRLRFLTGIDPKAKDFKIEEAYAKLLEEKGEKELFKYNNELTQKYLEANPKDKFNTQIAYDYMHERYPTFEKTAEYLFCVENRFGLELALETQDFDKPIPRVFMKYKPPETIVDANFEFLTKDRSRISSLSSTKTLTEKDEFYLCKIKNLNQLVNICDWWDELDETNQESLKASKNEVCQMQVKEQSLNRILFGAAGTGKTYHSINHALSIIEHKPLEVLEQEDRTALKKRFDQYKEQGQIKFVTFHQSFSYEDFVEGIRAESIEDSEGSKHIEYPVLSGVFKSICDAATVKTEVENHDTHFDEHKNQIWKMSLGRAGTDEEIYQYCIQNNCVLLGWGDDLDFSLAQNKKQIEKLMDDNGYSEYRKKYPSASRFVNDFKNKIKVGDLIIVSDGNHKFRAIAEVTGEYSVLTDEDDVPDYVQKRAVKWLNIFKPSLSVEHLFNKVLSQQTIYNLANAINLQKLKNILTIKEEVDVSQQNFVLIIDEINRGNISRIFGELITLIEDSKRQGAEEELSVTLPYSKEEFSIPSNVYIIGTMNSSDRSLTGIDIALRRRFTFIEMLPQPKEIKYEDGELIKISGKDRNGNDQQVIVADLLSVMNQRIEVLLDRDHCIGHANFMSLKKQPTLEHLATIFNQKIIPQLQEYFFDDWARINLILFNNGMIIEDKDIKIASLFPPNIRDDIHYSEQKKIWKINEEAFKTIDAFANIVGSKG